MGPRAAVITIKQSCTPETYAVDMSFTSKRPMREVLFHRMKSHMKSEVEETMIPMSMLVEDVYTRRGYTHNRTTHHPLSKSIQ